MSPDTLENGKLTTTKAANVGRNGTANAAEPEMIVDTSKMSAGKAAALEVAEAARGNEANARVSFAGGLFMGRLDREALAAFPHQSAAEKAVGDAMIERVGAFLIEHLDPDLVDEAREIPDSVIRGLHDLGVFRMKVPTEYGGLGFSQVNYNRVMQALATYCASTTVLVSAHQSIGVPQPLKMFGTDEQKKKYLPRISDGALSAFALTEPDVGSDPARMTTFAAKSDDGSHYILNGEKLWTTNGPIADLLVVMAQTQPKVYRGKERKQITAFIVEADSPGVEAVHRCDFMGLRGIHNGVIRFTDVRVPAENILLAEGKGLKLALATLNTGRLTLPAACTGLGKQCLQIARLWTNEREQWGAPIGKHEAGAQKIADIAATTFAMDAVTQLTSHWADEQRDIRIEAAMAKLFCSEAAWRLIDTTMQLRGGRGYERATSLRARGERGWPVERMMRDSRINRIIEGTTDIMHLFLAREALDPHLQVAADMLRRGVPIGRKMKAGLGMGGFYGRWYPTRWVAGRGMWRHRDAGVLGRHWRYADRMTQRLARTLFHSMARFGPGLEKRQTRLAALIEIGTELFAMTTTCAYAQSLQETDTTATELADAFCRQARARINGHIRTLKSDVPKVNNRLAKRVLAGDMTWLERGIIETE